MTGSNGSSEQASGKRFPGGPPPPGEDGPKGQVGCLPFRIDCCGLTETGSARTSNEDGFIIHPIHCEGPGPNGQSAYLLVVADGVGGAPAGEQASSIVLHTVRNAAEALVLRLNSPEGEHLDPGETLRRAIFQAQREIEEDLKVHPERSGMGTTLTAALVVWPRTYVVHVGDSRCYVLRGSRLKRVTKDHTMAQRMVDLGLVSSDMARTVRGKSALWNSVGGDSSLPNPQLRSGRLRWGDSLLLSTDGLTDSVPDREVERLIRQGGAAMEICHRLIQAAKVHGGRDDMTVVYATFQRTTFWQRIREILVEGGRAQRSRAGRVRIPFVGTIASMGRRLGEELGMGTDMASPDSRRREKR